MINFGIVKPGVTLRIPFDTFAAATGAPTALSNFAVGDILIYKDGNTTARASTTGYTATTTFSSITGINEAVVDLSSDATADFFKAGSNYVVVISPVTADGQTLAFVAATFSIGYPDAVLNTSIATLSSQTSFTLTTGPAEDDALNGLWAIVHDKASAVQFTWVRILDYTGATKTVTLEAAPPATFTIAAIDNFSVMGPAPLQAPGGVLSLKQLSVVNSTGDAVIAKSTGGNGVGIRAEGFGVSPTHGHGISAIAKGTDGSGLYVEGKGDGDGITAFGSPSGPGGAGIYAAAGVGSGLNGMGLVGDGVGQGLIVEGGAASVAAMLMQAHANGFGLLAQGAGTGAGIRAVGGATAPGIQGVGGATSGAGITGIAQGAGPGIAGFGGTDDSAGLYGEGQGDGDGIAGLGAGAGAGVAAYLGSGLGTEFLGSLYGDVRGDVIGNTGGVTGNVQGSVLGDLGGNVNGNVLGDVSGDLLGSVGGNVNGILVDFSITTRTEPGQGAPTATPTALEMMQFLYKAWRNKKTQTATLFQLFADDGTTVDQKAVFSDNGTTATAGEIVTGP